MPKVAIKNFDMPKSCSECKFMMYVRVTYDEPYGCIFTRKNYGPGERERPSDCPLVDIVDEDDDLK